MSRTPVTVLLALALLALSASAAFAQVFPLGVFGGRETSRSGRATESDAEMCQGAAGGSRVRSNCDASATPAEAGPELKVPVKPSSAPASAPLCEATTLTEYLQRNSTARITGSVSVKSCPAGSTGTYDLVVRVKDASGEIKPLEFREKWQSSESRDVTFTADYPIGTDAELLNVRVRNLRCTCLDVAEAPTQTDTASSDD